jgi:hypothetical protein
MSRIIYDLSGHKFVLPAGYVEIQDMGEYRAKSSDLKKVEHLIVIRNPANFSIKDEVKFAKEISDILLEIAELSSAYQTVELVVAGLSPAMGRILAGVHGVLGHFPAIWESRQTSPGTYTWQKFEGLGQFREMGRAFRTKYLTEAQKRVTTFQVN